MYLFLLFSGLSVTFENDLYSEGEEAGSVEVCAVLQGSTEVSVTVTIVVNEDTQLPNNRRASGKTLHFNWL